MKRIFLLFAIIVLMFLTGCSSQKAKEEKTTLVLASFGYDKQLQEQVDMFNQTHVDCKIEIQQYARSEQVEGDGIKKIQREIVSGNGPDIINFGKGYLLTDIIGEYTEDLFPYLEKNRGDYFTNIWDAFSYNGGLYAMPIDFSLNTYVSRRSVVGERGSWTIEELIDCYIKEKDKKNDTLTLYPGETKRDVFGTFLSGNVGNYVDWENGICDFTSDSFIRLLEFANGFPDSLSITDDFSPMQSFANGETLLLPLYISTIYDICKPEFILKEDVAYVGYPSGDKDGTVIEAGTLMLAISVGSKNKDLAWEFIAQFLEESYQECLTSGLPVLKRALEKQLSVAMTIEYIENVEGKEVPKKKAEIVFEGEEPILIYQISEKQRNVLWNIIESASKGNAYDSLLHGILLEEADGYFKGEKDLDEVVKVIQNRASLYVQENL